MPASLDKKKTAANSIWTVAAYVLAAVIAWIAFQTHLSGSNITFPSSRMEIQRSDGSKVPFKIELATTPEQQEHGLMFRRQLASNAGMLFVWPQEKAVSMWMKNTLIPLDMLFIASDGHIVKVINAIPNDLTPLSAGQVRAVMEIAGGQAAAQNIKEGDKILYPGFQTPQTVPATGKN